MKNVRSLLFAAALISSAASAFAATSTWDITPGDGSTITGGNGSWTTGAGNWNNGVTDTVWTAGDTAQFTSGTAGIITLGSAVSAGGLTLGSGAGQITLTATATNALSFSAAATVSLATGTTLVIDGTGSNFTLGAAGATITGGGTLEIKGGTTTVTSSPNSAADAALTIGSGTTIQVDTGATFRYQPGYTPGTTTGAIVALNGGTFASGGGLSGAFAGNFNGTGTILADTPSTGGVTRTMSGSFTGSGAFSLQNTAYAAAPNVLALSGDNSAYTGVFSINATTGARVVNFTSLNASGGTGSSVVVATGNTMRLTLGGSNFTSANVDTLLARTSFANGSVIGFDTAGGATTLTGVIANGNAGANVISLVRAGNAANDLSLSAANTYSGGSTLSVGRTILSNAAGLGTGLVTIASGAQVYTTTGTIANAFSIVGTGTDARGALRVGGGTITGNVTLAATAARISGAGSENGTISGIIGDGGSGYSLEIGAVSSANNLVSLTLSGANTYSGGTTISGGGTSTSYSTAIAGNAAAFGTGAITLNGGFLNTGGQTLANAIVVASTTTTGGIRFGGNATLNGAITGSGALNIAATSASSLFLNGSMSGYAGTVTLDNTSGNITAAQNGGAASTNTGSASANFVVNSGGTYAFSINRTDFAMGALSGNSTGKITAAYNTGVVGTLAVGALNTNTTYAGTFADAGSGRFALNKVGTGSLTLTGASTHTGGTTVTAGTLITGGTGTLGTGNVMLAGGNLTIGDGTVNNTVVIGSGANLLTTAATASVLKFTSTVANAITLTSGKYDFSAGTLTIDLGSLFNTASSYTLIGGGSGNVDAAGYTFINKTAGLNYAFSNGTLLVTAVPEPSVYGLIGAASLAGVALSRRRRK